MPDVAWCGGIIEWRRIADMAEVQYIRCRIDTIDGVAITDHLEGDLEGPPEK